MKMFDWCDRYDAGGDGYLDLEELKVLLTLLLEINASQHTLKIIFFIPPEKIGDHGEVGCSPDPLKSQSYDQRSRRRPGWKA